MLWVVDAHCTYQQGLNVASLAREGYSALIAKATQSIAQYVAPALLDTWIAQARAAGMVPGAYHWLTGADGRSQAEAYVRRIERHLGAGLMLAVDNEDTSSPASIAVLEAFVARVRELTGHQAMWHYSGAWWARQRIGSYPLASLGLLPWDAKYVGGTGCASVLYAGVPLSYWTPGYGGFTRSRMLQFSSHGTAGGIVGNVDVNAFDGTYDDLVAIAAGGSAEDQGGGTMAGEVADFAAANVTSPDGQTVGAHVALSAIWSGVEELRTRPAADGGGSTPLSDKQYAELADRLSGELRAAVLHAAGDIGDRLASLNDDSPPDAG